MDPSRAAQEFQHFLKKCVFQRPVRAARPPGTDRLGTPAPSGRVCRMSRGEEQQRHSGITVRFTPTE
ncbi:hypothetical protein OJAV_G00015420 [Oryzias javanicus]|uniref:Uncharacterized protein n=1 Tax=Oryzias javanicus TaxID=123683 RepID=A0A437DJM8_ORYJA|nr:hypothetical protein OJAV_G00015420 [Oryzias javanicus]